MNQRLRDLMPVLLPVLAVALLATFFLPAHPAATGIAGLVGAGLLDKLLCVSCVATLVALAVSVTPLAILEVLLANPEAASTCLALCYIVSQG